MTDKPNKDLDILRERLESDSFAKMLGIEYEEVRGGYCRARMKIDKKHLNLLNNPHGGAIFTLADAVFAGSCNGHGELAVAVTVTIDYIAPVAENTMLIAEGIEIHKTRKIGHYKLEVRKETGELVANAKGTAYFMGKTFSEWKEKK